MVASGWKDTKLFVLEGTTDTSFIAATGLTLRLMMDCCSACRLIKILLGVFELFQYPGDILTKVPGCLHAFFIVCHLSLFPAKGYVPVC